MDDIIKANNIFYGVDLHVHTPASSCYKGDKCDNEYLEILRRYSSKDIKVIAITDHNTIAGYRRFQHIKDTLLNKLNVLREFIDNHDALRCEYENIMSDYELFNKILILPGVEFEANPGIHMLLIFKPDCNLDAIDKFLSESGYSSEIQGKEESDILSNIDVLGVLDKSIGLDAIAIAAHADSNKGIYKLEGTYRASIFRSTQLLGICYNSPVTCQKMKSLLLNKEYKRDIPVAFLQASDYHGGEDEPGSSISYFKLDNIDYDSIYSALSKPDEFISQTPNPETINIIENIVKEYKTHTFEILEQTNRDLITKTACAVLNDGYGTLVFGVSISHGINMVGIKRSEDECIELLKRCLDDLAIKNGRINLYVSTHQFGNSRNVIIARLSSEKRTLYSINNKAYIFKGKDVIEANLQDIECIVETHLLSRMEEYNRLNQTKFDKIINEINLLKEDSGKFMILNAIEKTSVSLSSILDVTINKRYSGEFPVAIDNGNMKGNVYYVDRVETRLPNAYLRCTCPMTDKYDLSSINVQKFSGESIIIAPGGGCYYIDNNEEWGLVSLDKTEPTLVLTINEAFKSSISLKALAGWLKSSLFIWYSYTALNDINVHKPSIFKKSLVPLFEIMQSGKEIETLINGIIDAEYGLLTYINSDIPDTIDVNEVIDTHNKNVDVIAKQIDKLFFKELNISDDDEIIIKRLFDSKQIYSVLN